MTATYIPTSQIANDPAGILWLEKREGQPGKTTLNDIHDALTEYARNFKSGNISKAEILTLHRAYPDSPTYKQAAVGIQKMDMVDPLVIGGPASVEMIDREGHLITTNALSKAFQKFMDNQRTRNVMVLHSDVQVGWALPAYISKGGQIFKSGVGENGLFFICELRDDTAIAKKVADQINQGMLKSYSIAGSATKIQNMKKGETPYMQVDEMELAEVTICEKGVNQGASFELLKAELPQTGKIDKDQCGYRDATAPEEKMGINCGHCKYFNSDTRTCDVVVGDIMPGDYCRLFEQEAKPQAVVHRKIIIMHKDNTGRINFKDSFMGWMEKEKAGEDPLKSGKSFATLNNIAGREAEHHRLLEEYGFPSEPDLDTMRYIPVVETETDDDGKPIHIIPPWVVNEAGQDLGDKLDNDEIISVNKAMDIINDILRKAPMESDDPSAKTPNPRRRNKVNKVIDKAPIGTGWFDPSDPSKRQAPPQQAPENQYQMGQGIQTTTPNVPAPNTGASTEPAGGRQPQVPVEQQPQRRGAGFNPQARETQRTPGDKVYSSVEPQRGRSQAALSREKRGEEFGEMRRGAGKPLSQLQRLFRQGKRGAEAAKGRIAEGGRGVLQRGAAAGTEIRQQGREFGAGITGKRKDVRYRPDAEGTQRMGGAAYRLGRRTRGAGKDITSGTKSAVRGAKEFGEGLGEGFQSYDPKTAQFDRQRSGGGDNVRRDARGRLQRPRGGARRIGQVFGATGRGAAETSMQGAGLSAEGAFRGVREAGRFGRGVARGAAPGSAGQGFRDRDKFGPRTTRAEDGSPIIDPKGGRNPGASERFGQWLGSQGRERTADVLDTTGQTARGVKRGLVGKRGQEEYDRGDASAGETFGRWMGEAARGVGRDIPKIGSGSRRDRQQQQEVTQREGVGKGINFQPSAHRGASLGEQHQMVTGLADRINAGENMSPKEWMQVIHHMSQTDDGQRYANFSDIDIKHGDWNKPISFGDMRQHLDRMNVSHGTHGDVGKRGYANLINKIENVVSGRGDSLTLKPLTEGPGPDTNYEERQQSGRRAKWRNQRRNRRQSQGGGARPPDKTMEDAVIMNSYTVPVTDIFKRAFKISV